MADHDAHSTAFAAAVGAIVAQRRSIEGVGPTDPETDRPSPRAVRPTLADIGSGAGVPGLVLAESLPEVAVTLIDRREGRASWLEEAAAALSSEGLRIRVWCADVYDLAHGEARASFDLVTARAFDTPAVTAELGGALLGVGGVLLVSEPPEAPHRWDEVDLVGLGLVDEGPMIVEMTAGEEAVTGDRGAAGRRPDGGGRQVHFRRLARHRPLADGRPRRKPRRVRFT